MITALGFLTGVLLFWVVKLHQPPAGPDPIVEKLSLLTEELKQLRKDLPK
jgi:hypothetical protein